MKKSVIASLLVVTLVSFGSFAQVPSRNGAVNLSGSEDHYLRIKDATENLIAGSNQAFSYETWIKMTPNADSDFTLFDFQSGGHRVSFMIRKNDFFELRIAGSQYGEIYWPTINTEVDFINRWHHVAFTYDGNSKVRVYVDGDRIYSKNLSFNEIRIEDWSPAGLLPFGGNGHGNIGGPSINSVKGKAYLADTRLWNVQLFSSTIATYYDEAINVSHPNWGNLLRYYPLNDDYIDTGNLRKFADDKGNYDAVASTTSIRIEDDQFPIIKPPRFNYTTNWYINAETCQDDNAITVDWYDLASDADYVPVGTDFWYQLRREDNSTQIYANETNT